MVTLTEKAAAKVKEMLAAEAGDGGHGGAGSLLAFVGRRGH